MKDKKKSDEKIAGKNLVRMTLIVLVLLIALVLATSGGREGIARCLMGDRYSMESLCFDMNYRCQVECGNYGWNFTGQIMGCVCDCGDWEVSSCSGFAYAKNTSEVKVRITGDEVCTYADGHSEPCGYSPGVYNSSR
jgi:hypothetical protein